MNSTDQKRSSTPELDRQLQIIDSGKPQTVQDFIDWLPSQNLTIVRRCADPIHEVGRYCGNCQDSGYAGDVYDFESLMADFFGIDRNKIESERRALLNALRNEQES